MRKNFFTAKVNFYISVCFIFAFGLFMADFTLHAMRVESPITDALVNTQAMLQD